MTTKKRLKCFVACAFGSNEIDSLYSRVVRPTLRGLGIDSIRVDQVEHNDHIDRKIFQLIEECDLCIADLTFARPSVYFEAGFAEGKGKPVVYTVRKDHFKPREDDLAGNWKVHFDVDKKNIVAWSSSKDSSFATRLKRRLTLVSAPIKRSLSGQASLDQERKNFRSLSVAQQQSQVMRSVIRALAGRRYRFIRRKMFPIDDPNYPHWGSYGVVIFGRFRDPDAPLVSLEVDPPISDRYWTKIGNRLAYKGNLSGCSKLEGRSSMHLVVFTKPRSRSLLAQKLSRWRPMGDSCLQCNLSGESRKEGAVPTLAMISPVLSEKEFKIELSDVLNNLLPRR